MASNFRNMKKFIEQKNSFLFKVFSVDKTSTSNSGKVTNSLSGVLKNTNISTSDYKQYLENKYLL